MNELWMNRIYYIYYISRLAYGFQLRIFHWNNNFENRVAVELGLGVPANQKTTSNNVNNRSRISQHTQKRCSCLFVLTAILCVHRHLNFVINIFLNNKKKKNYISLFVNVIRQGGDGKESKNDTSQRTVKYNEWKFRVLFASIFFFRKYF